MAVKPPPHVRAVAERAYGRGDQCAVEFGVGSKAATAASARCKAWGNSFPRFSARRRMPAQAVGLKKYRGAIGPVSSVEDNEHAAPPLRHSEPLRIKHGPLDEPLWTQDHALGLPAVGGRIDVASCQCANHDSKVSAAVCAERSGDVFPQEPAGAAMSSSCIENPRLMVEQRRPRAGQSGTLAGDGKVLARRAADDDVDRPERRNLLIGDLGHVAQVRNVRVMVREHGRRERIDLRERDRMPPERMPCDRTGFDAGKEG